MIVGIRQVPLPLAFTARYIMPSTIFDDFEWANPNKGGEIN